MNILNQAIELIEKSRNIHIYTPENHEISLTEGDAFCAAGALFYALKKAKKEPVLFSQKVPSKEFQFLSNSKLMITVNGRAKDISEISYEKDDENLKIFLTSAQGNLSPNHLSFSPDFSQELLGPNENSRSSSPDLLIILGASDLEKLGEPFKKDPRFFYRFPILNIDNDPANQNFGEINLIDIKSCSVSELVANLLQEFGAFDAESPDENIATFLLSGIIWASENFRNPKTKPQTFKRASYLVAKGANHQKIIQNFYKTRPVSQIKLLGQVLEKLTFNGEKELYCASLTKKDFQKSGTTSKDLSDVLKELKFNYGNSIFSNFLLLWESHASPIIMKGIFYSAKPNLTERVLENFEGISRGKISLFLIREKELDTAYQKFLKII